MQIIQPYIEVPAFDGLQMVKNIEKAGRVCYKSEDRITEDSYITFLRRIVDSGHHSMFEHEKVTVKAVCDRGVTHEIVRHRIAAYSQESTRYCNYGHAGEITVIEPFFFQRGTEVYDMWYKSCRGSEVAYLALLENHCSPQEARSVLPNSLKTEIVMTYNLREWRHFFTLRADKAAHPQMQQIAIPLLHTFKQALYPLFDDIGYNRDFNPENYAEVKWMEE